MKPNIILWDLETLPNLTEVMKRIPSMSAWPGRTLKAEINSIICFGYKRLGDKNASCINAWDFQQKNINDDSAVVALAYEILKDADGIVTHNGKRFDLPVLNTRLMYWGFPPLHKIPHADTKIIAKRLSLYSNRLGDVSSFLGGESKLENGGWDLWVRVQNGDKAAMKLMEQYCKQDVEVLEQVFTGLRPLIKNSELPNYNSFTETDVCPNCGSKELHKHGVITRLTGDVQRYLCTNCGTTSSKKIDSKTRTKAIGV